MRAVWRRLRILSGGFFFVVFGIISANGSLDDLNLPSGFRRKIEDRKTVDLHLETAYRTEAAIFPTPIQQPPKRLTERSGTISLNSAKLSKEEFAARAAVPQKVVPLRGYRAPGIPGAGLQWSANLPANASDLERQAAAEISKRLATDGLLQTLARVLEILGPGELTEEKQRARLARIGFPVDLVSFFEIGEGGNVLHFICKALESGATSSALSNALAGA